MMFAAFALCNPEPAQGAADRADGDAGGAGSGGSAPLPLVPPAQQPDPQRDAWAAPIYQRLAASPLLSLALDARLPTVPVVLHPSAPRGADPPPVTARHLGFLRVDLTGSTTGPGRFFPLFPAGGVAARSCLGAC